MEFIKTYFAAEKSESLLFMAIGLCTLTFSAYAWLKWGDNFYKGFAVPVVMIALIQLVVGSTVYFRTDRQVASLEKLYQEDTLQFAAEETLRMQVVMKNFSVYKRIEIGFVLVGMLLMLALPSREFWVGVGIGMLLQGALMLTADVFAERRGNTYLVQVRSHLP